MDRPKDNSGDLGYHPGSNAAPLHTIEAWVAAKDSHRVVAVGYPRTLPLRRGICLKRMADIYDQKVQDIVTEILQEYKIQWTNLGIQRRWPRHQLPSSLHTLLIETQGEDSTQWRAAALRILGLFIVQELTSEYIEVEICNPSLMNPGNTSFVLPNDEGLLGVLESVKQAVYDLVQSSLGNFWSSVAFHMRRSRFNSSAELKPTVVVFVVEESCADFERFEKKLVMLLESLPVKVWHEVLPGSVSSSAAYDSKPFKFTEVPPTRPSNGASIAADDNETEAGTLGGWVNYRETNGRDVQCGLTCYSAIASHDPTIKMKTDQTGVRHEKPEGKLTVQYPARYDLLGTKERLEARKQESGEDLDAEDTTMMDYINQKLKPPTIGRVFFASGLRTNKANRRMDWALIETPSTFAVNKPPPAEAFPSAEAQPWPEKYGINSDSKIRHFGRITLGEWVAKTGRTSSYTSGTVNQMRRRVCWEAHGGLISEEVEVLGLTKDFAESGDSGSFVTNARGELVGLLIGRDACSSNFDIGFVTPIEDIQEDVKRMVEGFLSLED